MSTHLSDDEAQRLLRLLALKRHEVPPPGFFDRLPARVLLNIRAGTEMPDRAWWERALDLIRHEPMVAGSYAALGVGAALFGVSVFQMALDPEVPGATTMQGLLTPTQPVSVFMSATPHVPQGVIYRLHPEDSTGPWNSPLLAPPPTTVVFRSNLEGVEPLRIGLVR